MDEHLELVKIKKNSILNKLKEARNWKLLLDFSDMTDTYINIYIRNGVCTIFFEKSINDIKLSLSKYNITLELFNEMNELFDIFESYIVTIKLLGEDNYVQPL